MTENKIRRYHEIEEEGRRRMQEKEGRAPTQGDRDYLQTMMNASQEMANYFQNSRTSPTSFSLGGLNSPFTR